MGSVAENRVQCAPGKRWGEMQISDSPFLLRGEEGLEESTSWVKPRLETGQPGPAGQVRGSSTRVEPEQTLQSGQPSFWEPRERS